MKFINTAIIFTLLRSSTAFFWGTVGPANECGCFVQTCGCSQPVSYDAAVAPNFQTISTIDSNSNSLSTIIQPESKKEQIYIVSENITNQDNINAPVIEYTPAQYLNVPSATTHHNLPQYISENGNIVGNSLSVKENTVDNVQYVNNDGTTYQKVNNVEINKGNNAKNTAAVNDYFDDGAKYAYNNGCTDGSEYQTPIANNVQSTAESKHHVSDETENDANYSKGIKQINFAEPMPATVNEIYAGTYNF
uniref:Serine/threonine-protein kinase clkA n=1 Tax=Rhabditophanes sp. KR3021 TaxID=114890 RepID=A0AC35UI25_9BILA